MRRKGIKLMSTPPMCARQSACLAFIVLASCLFQAAGAQPQSGAESVPKSPSKLQPGRLSDEISVNADLISFNVTVNDKDGHSVSGLPKEAFTVFDEKQQQEIAFFSDDDAPVSFDIIFDVSGSMSGDKINRAREALAHFIKTSHPEDEYALITFNTRAEVLMESTRDADTLLSRLASVQPHGDTALNDAVSLGVEKLQRGAHRKRAILLITDGGENHSRYTFKESRAALSESGVVLYSICVLDPINLAGKAGMRVQDTLNSLSEITGGKAFYPDSQNALDEDFERIALELRHQYSIGYKPRRFSADGRWHRLRVKVKSQAANQHLLVRSRKGYYAISGTR